MLFTFLREIDNKQVNYRECHTMTNAVETNEAGKEEGSQRVMGCSFK